MNILEENFLSLVQCAGTLYFVVGIILAFLKVPRMEVFRPYFVSKNLLSACFFVVGTNLWAFLFVFGGDWHKYNPTVICLDLVLFYLAGILFSNVFCNLLDKHYITRRRITVASVKWSLTTACAVLSLFDFVPALGKKCLLIFACLMFLQFVFHFLLFFFKRFRKVRKALDNYYTESQLETINWSYRCIFLIITAGFLSVATMVQGVVFNWLFQGFMLSTCIYITVSFINFKDHYIAILRVEEEITDDDVEEQKTENIEEKFNTLDILMNKWVNEQKYKQNQFTIEDVAKEVGTNKSYLSAYINQKFDMSFSSWITSLRIKEAKDMFRKDPNTKVETVAFDVGFSSSSYFSKAFSKQEGISPVQWKKDINRK